MNSNQENNEQLNKLSEVSHVMGLDFNNLREAYKKMTDNLFVLAEYNQKREENLKMIVFYEEILKQHQDTIEVSRRWIQSLTELQEGALGSVSSETIKNIEVNRSLIQSTTELLEGVLGSVSRECVESIKKILKFDEDLKKGYEDAIEQQKIDLSYNSVLTDHINYIQKSLNSLYRPN